MIEHYLKKQGLARLNINQIGDHLDYFYSLVDGTIKKNDNDLFTYSVPKLGPGGSCSITQTLEAEPHDLGVILQGREYHHREILIKLHEVIAYVKTQTNQQQAIDWFGIYAALKPKTGPDVLTKLAYCGAPSRAEFPLTDEFAQISTNVTTAKTGNISIVQNIADYQAHGGAYYLCDPEVQSEVCIPIIYENQIYGIIDAESKQQDFFSDDLLCVLIASSLFLAEFFHTLSDEPLLPFAVQRL